MVKYNENLGDLDQFQNLLRTKVDKDPCSDFFFQKEPISSICAILKKQGTS